jgi:hypothetical protein
MIGDPSLAGAVHVYVREGGLADANVFTGAGAGLPGAKAYRIDRVPGTALKPHTVLAQTDIVLVKPSVTAEKE